MTKINLIEKNFKLGRIITFHTYMAAIALIIGALHYPLVRIGRTYTTSQIRTGTLGFLIFLIPMFFALIFMSNRVVKYRITNKLRVFASKIKIRYIITKNLHNLTILGVIVIFGHTRNAYTSTDLVLMSSVYLFFFTITLICWIYHKLLRRFRSKPDPYCYHKVSWDVVIADEIHGADTEWALQLLKENPSLYPCLQCGTCTANCLISEVTKGEYNPRSNILASLFGYKDSLFKGDELKIWGCTTCNTCDVGCPQKIELTEIFTYLKNQGISQGKGPDYIFDQARTVFETGKAIPFQSAIERRRIEMRLPQVLKPDVNEISGLIKNLGLDKKLKAKE